MSALLLEADIPKHPGQCRLCASSKLMQRSKLLGRVITQGTPLNNRGQGDGNYHQADG